MKRLILNPLTIGPFSRLQVFTFLCIILMTACSTSPAKNFDHYALSAGLSKTIVRTNKFSIRTYSRSSLNKLKSSPSLNIYLSGDGTPWITPNHKSIDPTPRKRIALDLMLLDQNPSIYVGRPCYHATFIDPACDPKWWTSHRYSREVIAALLEAINSLRHPSQQLNIIGFSGGGSLAMLLAPKLVNSDGTTNINSVVTISANLDIQKWASRHNYTLLTGSLNPIHQAPLDSNIKQFHLLGELDKNIDAAYLSKKLNDATLSTVQIFQNFNHHCCWSEIWPQFTSNLK